MKQYILVLSIVNNYPVTSNDVADVIGIPVKIASAVLSDLYTSGLIARKNMVMPSGGKRKSWLYTALEPQQSEVKK